jgi:hypothetical protein
MEKIMIFSLSAWFGIMLTVAPRMMKNDQAASPVSRNENVRVSAVQQKSVYRLNATDKLHAVSESAILLHDPR